MAGFANLRANLNLNIQDFASKLRSASGQVDRFAAKINGKTVQSMKELNKQTNAWGLNLKSVSRVVSGIVIAQTFYRILQSVQQATNAVWEFSKELEYAHIAYSNLFGDVALANEFINVLKDFAAESPFSFTESEKAAKRLLAYGIEYKNVMYVMQGVMSAAAIQGDPAKIESISRAFGQIYTYGKLMTQEVRQLSEAGIPAFEILQEELGLTQEQLRNLGNEGIPASDAINALVDGIQKRFGNVTLAATKTITGIISNLKDNATMLFAGLFEPLTVMIKSALAELGQFFYALREIFELKGAGGVFEALFPPEMHATMRQFAANIQLVLQAVMRLIMALGSALKPVLHAVIMLFNAFAPIISIVASVLAEVVQMITSNTAAMQKLSAALAAAAAMWVIFKIRAIASAVITAVIGAISKALAGLAAVLTFVMAHPFWTMLMVLGGVLVGLSGGFSTLSNKVSGFFKTLTGFGGVDPDKVLLPSQKERANDLDKFNNKLEGTSDAMDDLADSTGKATKAAAGLLSFDEVFKLNEPDEGSGNGIDPGELDLGDLGGGLGDLDSYMPEVPDFSDYLGLLKSNFLGKFKDAWENIKERIPTIVSTALGAGFGGLLGYLLGGKIGGIFGAIAGALVGHFWGVLADKFGLTPEQRTNAAIIGGIGAGLGAILGGLIGGPLGAKIGAVIGGLVGSFWGLLAEKFNIQPEQHISTLISGGISGILAGILTKSLKGGAIGAIAGLGVGLLSNALTGWIAEECNLTEKDLENAGIGQTIGSILGTIIGGIIGGPLGAVIGGSIGQLVGSIVGVFWTTIKDFFVGLGKAIGDFFSDIGDKLSKLGDWFSNLISSITGFFATIWDKVVDFFEGIVDFISPALNAIWSVVSIVWNDIKTAVTTVLSDIWSAITTVWNDILDALGTILSDIWDAVSTVWTDIKDAVTTVCNAVWGIVSAIFNLIKGLIVKVVTDIWNAVVQWFTPIAEEISSVCSAIWETISTAFSNILNTITTTLSSIWKKVSSVFKDIFNTIKTKLSEIFNEVSQKFSSMLTTVGSYMSSIFNSIKTHISNAYTTVKNTVSNIYNAITGAFSGAYESVKSSISNVYTTVTDGIANLYNTFVDWVSDLWDNVFGKLFGWIEDGIDKLAEFFGLSSNAPSFSSSIATNMTNATSVGGVRTGHATGGIFNREHIARFSEGNKAEAIIPLENNTAMQPFVDAVANGLTASLAPMLANMNYTSQTQQLQPLYVGTLIADDRGLKELERKMEIIRLQESRR